MFIIPKNNCFIAGIAVLFLTVSCNTNNSSTTVSIPVDSQNAKPLASVPADGPAIATVSTPTYTLKIHKATSFVPKDESDGIAKPKMGNRFIVLDMSVKNISAGKEVDMGQILLMAKITDEKGKVIPLEPSILAAWSMEHPDPNHQSQYESIWDKLGPGSFYRTEAYAIEAPATSKHFSITLKEDATLTGKSPEHTVEFTAE